MLIKESADRDVALLYQIWQADAEGFELLLSFITAYCAQNDMPDDYNKAMFVYILDLHV